MLSFIKGLAVGIADLIPGISGATVCLILGVYQRVIDIISQITLRRVFSLLLFPFSKKARDDVAPLQLGFAIPFGIGVLFSLLVLSRIILYFYQTYQSYTVLFFAGLIFASTSLLLPKAKPTKHPIQAVFGALLGLSTLFLISITLPKSFVFTIIMGFIAISMMLLPGISGSYMLELFGYYDYILQSISTLDFFVLIPFAFGGLFAVVLVSRLIGYLLSNFYDHTFTFFIAFIIASLSNPLVRSSDSAMSLIFFVCGFIVVALMEILRNLFKR